MQATLKLLDIARDRRKTLKKEKEKQKMNQTRVINILLSLIFYIEKFVFC